MITGGLDEVGWGAAAGPIVSVVVVMRPGDFQLLPKGVTDSKKLSAIRRDAFFMHLLDAATNVGLGSVEPWEVDELGPKFALQESYRRAIAELTWPPDLLYVDGTDGMNRVRCWGREQKVEPKADRNHVEVSMASIIAKVIRDEVMITRAKKMRAMGLPDYGWEQNKGYLTPDHFAAIKQHGLLFGPNIYQHRRSYCSELLGKVKIYGRDVGEVPLL